MFFVILFWKWVLLVSQFSFILGLKYWNHLPSKNENVYALSIRSPFRLCVIRINFGSTFSISSKPKICQEQRASCRFLKDACIDFSFEIVCSAWSLFGRQQKRGILQILHFPNVIFEGARRVYKLREVSYLLYTNPGMRNGITGLYCVTHNGWESI